jgi:hypothetical protein
VKVDDGRFGDPRRRADTRYPLLIEPSAGSGDDALFEDARQLAPPVGPGGAGSQTDRWGEEYKTACVRRPQRPGGETAPLPKPWSQDEWDPFTAPGADKPPEPKPPPPEPKPPPEAPERPICIGSQCLHPKGETAPPPSPAPAPPAAKAPEPPRPQEVILGVSANERYEGEREWPWWKKLLYPFFRGWKAPESRPISRAAYELQTLKEEERRDEVELTPEAEALAKRDLAAFYRTCGTHRVRQVVERKGVAYHFSTGSPGDREISVLPYGVSRQTADRPELHPAQAQPFLDDQAPWLEQLSSPSPALPQRFMLEPWSELLLETGTVQPHQLSPLQK